MQVPSFPAHMAAASVAATTGQCLTQDGRLKRLGNNALLWNNRQKFRRLVKETLKMPVIFLTHRGLADQAQKEEKAEKMNQLCPITAFHAVCGGAFRSLFSPMRGEAAWGEGEMFAIDGRDLFRRKGRQRRPCRAPASAVRWRRPGGWAPHGAPFLMGGYPFLGCPQTPGLRAVTLRLVARSLMRTPGGRVWAIMLKTGSDQSTMLSM